MNADHLDPVGDSASPRSPAASLVAATGCGSDDDSTTKPSSSTDLRRRPPRRSTRRCSTRRSPTTTPTSSRRPATSSSPPRTSSPRSRPATSRRPRRPTPAARVHFERIEPVAGAFGDLDPDIDGREGDIPPRRVGRLSPDREGALDRRDDRGPREDDQGAAQRRRQPQRHRDQGRLRPGRDRPGLGRPAGRGLGVEDHRRGGALLAHRPLGLRGQRRRGRGRVRGAGAGARAGRPRARRRDRDASSRPCTRCSTSTARATASSSTTPSSEEQTAGARAADRHARRAALAGPVAGRLTDDDRTTGARPAAGSPGGACSRPPGSPAPGSGSAPPATRSGMRRARGRPGDGTGTVPFWGERQAGIVTAAAGPAALRRLRRHRGDPRGARGAAARVDRGGGADDRRACRPGRATPSTLLPPDDTGEALRPPAQPADDHLRRSAPACSSATASTASGSPRSARAALRQLPPLPAEAIDPDALRRRPLRPGVLGRSPGRLPRGPQPGPDRPRLGGHALVAARLRPHRDDHPRPGHARAT